MQPAGSVAERGTGAFVASDAAPDSGNYPGPGPIRFADPAGDHQSAPDIGSIRVTDTADGERYAITPTGIADIWDVTGKWEDTENRPEII